MLAVTRRARSGLGSGPQLQSSGFSRNDCVGLIVAAIVGSIVGSIDAPKRAAGFRSSVVCALKRPITGIASGNNVINSGGLWVD